MIFSPGANLDRLRVEEDILAQEVFAHSGINRQRGIECTCTTVALHRNRIAKGHSKWPSREKRFKDLIRFNRVLGFI